MKSSKEESASKWRGSYSLYYYLLITAVVLFSFGFLVNISQAFNLNNRIFLSSTEKTLTEPLNLILINENSLQAISPLNIISPRVLGTLVDTPEKQDENRNTIIEYIVKEGDSLWSIADEFNISVNTIVWANDLKRTTIRPNQKLIILPVSGVKHIVQSRDTISKIAEMYGEIELSKILDFNNISNENDISIGQSIIIPGGIKQRRIEQPTIPINRTARTIKGDINLLSPDQVRANFSTNNYWGQSHAFPFGQCTWWPAQKRPIGRWGHAKSWIDNAQRDGLEVCRGRYCQPQDGAVIVVVGNPIFGHVAYVEEVRGNKIIYSEMNSIGWGKINKKTIQVGDADIIGFIY